MTHDEAGRARRTLRRWAAEAWSLLPRTAAATLAWVIARHIVGNHDPFFAPLSAVIALNAPLGERGRNALRLLLGVVIGIVVGELTVIGMGGGYGALALATFAAMVGARVVGGARIVMAQAAGSAILTVTVADGQVGLNRLVDALIGGGVALVFSQVIFSPEPVGLVRRAEAQALGGMSDGLDMTARALERDDDELAESAVGRLRDVRDHLTELARLRHAGRHVARHSAIWRSQLAPVVRETEDAGHLDLLGGSCLMLARVAAATPSSERASLAPLVRELADTLAHLAKDLGDRATRQHAADSALEVGGKLGGNEGASAPVEAIQAMRMVAADIITFAGVDAKDALEAVRAGTGEFRVPAPPSAPRLPFGLSDWRRR